MSAIALPLALALSCGGTSDDGGGGDGGRNGDAGSDGSGGSDQGGSDQGGSNQGGSNQGGSNQGGSNQGGSNQGGSNQGGGDQGGSNQGGGEQGGQPGSGGSNNGGSGGSNNGGSGGSNNGGSGGAMQGAECNSPCDDMESYNNGQKPGGAFSNFQESGGTLSISTERAFSGTKSVKFTLSDSGNKQVRMRHNFGGNLPQNELWMRAQVWLDGPLSGTDPFHWNLMHVRGNSGNFVSGGNNSGNTFQHGVMGGRDCYVHGGDRVPTGRWVCWEFHVDGAGDNAETYLDGDKDIFTQVVASNPIPGQSGCLTPPGNNWQIPNIQEIYFGFTASHPMNGTATMYMDDIVVSDTRIPCP